MRRLTLMLVGTMAMGGAGIFALACSSDPVQVGGDDDDTGTSSGNGSSGSSGSSGTSGTTSSGGSGSSTSSGGSSSGGCRAALRPAAGKGPYCPFIVTDNPDKPGGNCDTGKTCCLGATAAGGTGFDPSSCAASADACPDPTDPEQINSAYECTEKDDCVDDSSSNDDAGADGGGGKMVCCVIPNPKKADSPAPTLGTGKFDCPIAKGAFGTRCRSKCGGNEVQGCQADADCPTGKTCTLASVGPGGNIYMGMCQ